MNKFHILLGLTASAMLASTAHAADHTNLEPGLPLEVEDAYPTGYLNREFQFSGRYERTADGGNQFVLDPRLEYGFARNWQARINVPFILGGGDKRGSGDIGAEVFYNFNTESLKLPAFAASVNLTAPTGRDSSGLDSSFKLIATKSLGYAEKLQRVHLNLTYFNNASARFDERSNGYAAVVGYSQRVGPQTIFLADYARQQQKERNKTSDILEVGLRYQQTPLTALSIGLGAGVSKDSPDFRATLGLQRSFYSPS